MTATSQIILVFDTSFFRSIYDVQGGNVVKLVAKLVKNLPSQYSYVVPKTVLREYSKTRVLLQGSLDITDDANIDIVRLKKINEQLPRRAFDRTEIGDFKIIAIALQEARKGNSPIIVTNDEGFRIFVRNGLKDVDIGISLTPDFLNFLSRFSVSKQDKALLRAASKKVDANYSQYRRRHGRGDVKRSVLETVLSLASIRVKDHPEIKQLQESIQAFFNETPVEEIAFPTTFSLFRTTLKDFCTYLDIGKLRQAKMVLDQLVSRCKENYDATIFSELDEIIHSILQYGYYKLAVAVDKEGEWWEALGLLHSYQTLHVVRAQKPSREIQLALTFANYIARGYSGLDLPILSYEQFLSLLDLADLGLLHEIEAVATVANNLDLSKVISNKISEKSGLTITNKLKRTLEGHTFNHESPLEVKTPFDDIMAIMQVQSKRGSKENYVELFCSSIAGPICLRIPVKESSNPFFEKIEPGMLIAMQQAEIKEIRSPPVGVRHWNATFILGENPVFVVNQKRPLLEICSDLVGLYLSSRK